MQHRRFIAMVCMGWFAASLAAALSCHRRDAGGNEAPPKQSTATADVVELNAEGLKRAGIHTAVVTETEVNVPLVVPGRISFDLNRTAKVTSTLDGRILQMNHDVGERVRRGDVMALVDTPELLKPLELKAPMDGRVVERRGTVGELLEKSQSLYTISDVTKLWCIAAVNENDLGVVHVGERAAIAVLPYPGETFPGEVIRLGDTVDEHTRTTEVRIEVQNPGGRLKAGMFATASLRTDAVAKGLFVPDAALQTIRGRQVVFVEEHPGSYRMTPINLGRELGPLHEVLDGLSPAARVVTDGSFILKSELLKGELKEED